MLKIKLGTLEDRITSLSGGNQQKVIIGRWLMTRPSVLFLDEPTRGIDVGAKFEIYTIMNDLVDQGVGIIMISSDLPEILGMSDRILVMHDGRITGQMERAVPLSTIGFVLYMNSYEGIPLPVIILIMVTLIFAFIAANTRFGRRLYAIGGNPEAARLSGIDVAGEGFKIYLVVGALSALSGIILTARLDGATASAGTSFEFDSISATIIGGASFMGGEGTVRGLALLIAVWFDISARNKGRA